MSPLCVVSHFVSFQRAGCHFSKYGKFMLWWEYQAMRRYSSSSFPSQMVMPDKSCLAWGSHRINLIIKGLRSVQEPEHHFTCFVTQSASGTHLCEISRLWRSAKDDVPEQKCAASLVREGPVQLVHREEEQLLSLVFQLSVRSIKESHIS